jgi:predicted RNase H-like nuclease
MTAVCGVDGCKAGWIAVFKDLDSGACSWQLFRSARELLAVAATTVATGIDIPIGLPARGPRECDMEARRLLGRGRGSSVFPAPIRPVLAAPTYEKACAVRSEIEQKKLSRQLWNIVPKIREVDAALQVEQALHATIHEVHPEVSFFALAGERPMAYNKKARAGRDERLAVLEPVFGRLPASALGDRRALGSDEDDILDAFAVLWTAERIAAGKAHTIPATPPTDACGLRMEIVV